MCASTISVRSICTPAARGSTSSSVRPSSEVRAATMKRSATWPSSTKVFAPYRRKPLPSRVALAAIAAGPVFARLVDRQRDHRFGRGDLGQQLGLLRLRAGACERARGEHGGGQKWRRRERASERFADDAGLHRTQAQAAVRLGHQNRAIALVGELAPQRAIETDGVAAVAQFAQMRDRRALGQETP